MKEICWKLVGGDCLILKQSELKSQKSFLVLGMMYAFLATITFISFFGLFVGIFKGILLALFGSLLFTFIISNLYRLVIITLEPSTLPVAKEHKVKFWAYFVRVGIIILLAAFISKVIETMLFGHWVDHIVEKDIRKTVGELSFNQFKKSEYFILHLKDLNLEYPFINIMTLFVISLYVFPVIIKHRLKKRGQYYQIKRIIDKQIVESEYQKMLNVKEALLSDLCLNNQKPYKYCELYEDEPFNTRKKIKDQKIDKNHTDFLMLFD